MSSSYTSLTILTITINITIKVKEIKEGFSISSHYRVFWQVDLLYINPSLLKDWFTCFSTKPRKGQLERTNLR